jgi:hypothetical protein
MIVEITNEQREYAKNLATLVAQKMQTNGLIDNPFNKAKDKFYADYIGFLGETCFADKYKLTRPEFTGTYKDKADFIIKGKNYDLKTNNGTTVCMAKDRYWKQKEKYDGYIFAELQGNYFHILGWEDYSLIPFVSKEKLFLNGIKMMVINKSKLRKIEELL